MLSIHTKNINKIENDMIQLQKKLQKNNLCFKKMLCSALISINLKIVKIKTLYTQ